MTVKKLNDVISGLETQKATLESEAAQHTLLRRKLHNEIQELKGDTSMPEERTVSTSNLYFHYISPCVKLTPDNLHAGNIRVFCRVRPKAPNSAISAKGIKDPVTFPSDDPDRKQLVFNGEVKASVDGTSQSQKQWEFNFDKVFRPNATQETVFEDISQVDGGGDAGVCRVTNMS